MFLPALLSARWRNVISIAVLVTLLSFLFLPVAGAQDNNTPDAPAIIGGQEASPGEWPWQVALIYAGYDLYDGQFCGGSLIAEQWVLTAAHCVVEGGLTADPGAIQVVAGVHDLMNPEDGYQVLDVQDIVVHADYDADTSDNDIALLELTTAATLGPTAGGEVVDIVPLVSASVGNLAGQTAAITGWGDMSGDADYATTLMEGSVPVVTNTNCNDANSYSGQITDNMLCAGYAAGGVDTCQGDSGGPLVVNGPNWELAGVTSWGTGCALPEKYGVYTRVSRYVGWIDAILNPPAAPTITSFSPMSGRAGDTVTIDGTDLLSLTGVDFNGVEAITFAAVSDSQATAVVPPGTTSGKITVTTLGGAATSDDDFVIIPPPTISGFTPASGPVGSSVTVNGAAFVGVTSVKINGKTAVFSVVSDSQLTLTVPTGATSGKISVTTPSGTAVSSTSFTVVLPPSISSFSPSSGAAANTTVTINGANLTGATSVSFGGVATTPTSVASNKVVARVPAGAVTGKIKITTPGGEATSSGTFTVLLPPPTISSFTPSTGGVGTEVRITGLNFSGVTKVMFNGKSARFETVSTTEIKTWVNSDSKTGRLTVSTLSGTATSTGTFTVLPKPEISKFSPTYGSVGTTVVISGKNFTGASLVKFGSVAATISSVSSSRIVVTVPAGAVTSSISVTTPGGLAVSKYAFAVR